MSSEEHPNTSHGSSSRVALSTSVGSQADDQPVGAGAGLREGSEDALYTQENTIINQGDRSDHGSLRDGVAREKKTGDEKHSASEDHNGDQDWIEDQSLEQQVAGAHIHSKAPESHSKIPEEPLLDRPISPTPPPPLAKDAIYLDPTPQTPSASKTPSRTPSVKHLAQPMDAESRASSPYESTATTGPPRDDEDDQDEIQNGAEVTADSRSEIQSIMDQFDEEGGGPGEEEVMSPRLELAGSSLGASIQHPPRKSSLEPISTTFLSTATKSPHFQVSLPPTPDSPSQIKEQKNPLVPSKASSVHSFSLTAQPENLPSDPDNPMSPTLHPALHKPPPPEPDPDSDLPFDFHRFLEQLRHRTADPVAKFLRSFLSEFGKKQWMVHEQVKIISDFLAFITNKMAQCEVWRGVSDAEFDNAREGMEKLVMNRLYSQTFSPAIPASQTNTGAKGKRKAPEKTLGISRRGQHQEDVERDEVLAQKVRIYGWVREKHLDIDPVGDSSRKFLVLAQQELLKIRTYRAPRDKVICVLNCCKVIFGLLRNLKSDTSADSFVPLLIYVVLQANPEHMVSNVQYILRFRNQDKLGGEAGYYLSSLMGAVQFIENLDRTTLTISDDEFEKNVEAAVSAIAEKHEETPLPSQVQISEKSTLSRPEVTPRHSLEGERTPVRRSVSSREGLEHSTGGDGIEEKAAVAGLLRTIQRPLSSLGRIFSEDNTSQQQRASSSRPPGLTPQPIPAPMLNPLSHQQQPTQSSEGIQHDARHFARSNSGQGVVRDRTSAADAAARQASAEAAEIQRVQRAEHHTVVETLSGMFPALDKDVISDVVSLKEGRVGAAVDACLALNS